MKVRNIITVYGSIKDLYRFIKDNFIVDESKNESVGNYQIPYVLFFGKSYPSPEVRGVTDEDKIIKWRMKNWGTLNTPETDSQHISLTVLYSHSEIYHEYVLSTDNKKFNPYTLRKLSEHAEMPLYITNLHKNANQLQIIFDVDSTPPIEIFKKWVERFYHSTLLFDFIYASFNDDFAGSVQYDYDNNNYIISRYDRETNLESYLYFIIKQELADKDYYIEKLAELYYPLMLKKDPDLPFARTRRIIIEEIKRRSTLEEQVSVIAQLFEAINKSKKV